MTSKQLRKNLVDVYNLQAEQRNKSQMHAWKAVERAHFLSLLKKEKKGNLLEIGAGHGRDSLFFQDQGLQVTCIDLSPRMVELCQQKGLEAHVMDMVLLDFEHNSFDAVYALNSFLHLPKDEFPMALEKVCNVLRPTGLFFLGIYGGFEFEGSWEKDSYTPKRFFSFHSDENLKKILVDKFEIIAFKRIQLKEVELHFQSAFLRNPEG